MTTILMNRNFDVIIVRRFNGIACKKVKMSSVLPLNKNKIL